MTTPLMKHLFFVSFILIILLLASQSFQTSAHEVAKSSSSALDKKGDDNVSADNVGFQKIEVVNKKDDKKKKKKKKKDKSAAAALLQKGVSPFQVLAFVGYFIFFGFFLF